MQLSTFYSLEQLTFSETAARSGVANVPGPKEVANLKRLASNVLEPMRALLADDYHINSGYRTLLLNTMVGSKPDSAHVEGRAADCRMLWRPLREAFDMVRASDIPYDQIILECGAWIHIAIARLETAPRRMALLGSGVPGNWTYQNA